MFYFTKKLTKTKNLSRPKVLRKQSYPSIHFRAWKIRQFVLVFGRVIPGCVVVWCLAASEVAVHVFASALPSLFLPLPQVPDCVVMEAG